MKKIYVVGLGPGNEDRMTLEARNVLSRCDVIVGYDYYIGPIASIIEGKTVISTPMKKEVERCEAAVESALNGHTVAMVCSGDAGVYGMAGILLEVAAPYSEVDIEVVCGVTAACSCAAVLGAPLVHDFAVISLSDLLTPWEKIEKRLRCAAEADFVICLYNPSSRKRQDYLKKACEQILLYQPETIRCGYVKNAGRKEEESMICTLGTLKDCSVDMFTTVIIGNSQTKVVRGKLVTPRGYRLSN